MSDKKQIVKEYSNKDLTIVWKPDLCTHSKKCWKELLQVFDPRNRPWINLEGATSERIKKQVKACPSKALSLKEDEIISEEKTNQIEVKCMQNGPLMVMGNVHITNSNGTTEQRKKVTAFCRCGASTNKPFCDGKHNDINFEG